jgi:hypothetical protein
VGRAARCAEREEVRASRSVRSWSFVEVPEGRGVCERMVRVSGRKEKGEEKRADGEDRKLLQLPEVFKRTPETLGEKINL